MIVNEQILDSFEVIGNQILDSLEVAKCIASDQIVNSTFANFICSLKTSQYFDPIDILSLIDPY